MAVINLYPTLFETQFDLCDRCGYDNEHSKFVSEHPSKKNKLLAYVYLGMGHYGYIIEDTKKFYHCLMVGGSNYYDRLRNYICFMFYDFSNPAGHVIDLNHATFIKFMGMEMNKELNKKYMEILDKFNYAMNYHDFYEKLGV